MSPVVQVLAFLPILVVARVRRVEQQAVDRLNAAGANTSERAILLQSDQALARWVCQRLQRAGVLCACADDRYYLDAAAYEAYQGRRRRRGMLVAALLLMGVGVLYAGGFFA